MKSTERAQRGRRTALHGSGLTVWIGLLVAAAMSTASTASAQGIPRDEGFMKEPKAVDYRRFVLAGKFDLGVFGDLSVKDQLTTHYGGAFTAAYNFNEYWAAELLLEGGYGGVTDLTTQIQQKEMQGGATGLSGTINDVAGGGALIGTGQIGVRFTPIYGKFNVTSEIPIHFNFYASLGVGGAYVQYNEILGCETDPVQGQCAQFHSESHPVFAFNGGLGFRFYINQLLSIRLELHDIVYPDLQYQSVNLAKPVESRTADGGPTMAGLTQTPLILAGVGFLL